MMTKGLPGKPMHGIQPHWSTQRTCGPISVCVERVLGGFGVAMGAQDRIMFDLGSILSAVLGPQTEEHRLNIDARMRSHFAFVFGWISDRFRYAFEPFLGHVGHHLEDRQQSKQRLKTNMLLKI